MSGVERLRLLLEGRPVPLQPGPPRVFDWRSDCPPQDLGGRPFPAVVGRGRGHKLRAR